MTDSRTGRPAPDEHLPYYAQYIRLVPDGPILDTLAREIEATARFLAPLSAEDATRRPTPDDWSLVEVLGHLADAERVFAYRILRIARADPTPWESVEFDDYAAASGYARRDLDSVMAELVATRAATIALLAGLDAAAWRRRAPEDWTTRSVRAIAYAVAGHEIHHREDWRDRYGVSR